MAAMDRFLLRLASKPIIIKAGQGDEVRDFSVPRDILSHACELFDRALQEDRFKEGRENQIAPPDDPPDVVAAFIHYAYQEQLVFDDEPNAERRNGELCLCYGLWTFADKYLLRGLQNSAMERVCDLLRCHTDKELDQIPSAVLTKLFTTVKEESPLRLMVTDYIVNEMKKDATNFTLAEDLGACKGFIPSLHASEVACHTPPAGDFPRYDKPTKFAKLLHVKLSDFETREDASGFNGNWGEAIMYCNACGYLATKLSRFCISCETTYCDCVYTTIPDTEATWLCSHCVNSLDDEEL